MLKKLLLLCLATTFLGSFQMTAQVQSTEKIMEDINVMSSKAVFLGKTKPVRELVAKQPTAAEKKAAFRSVKQKPSNFPGRSERNEVLRPDLEHQGPDPIRQSKQELQRRFTGEPLVNIDGISLIGSQNDPSGDVGQDYYVQGVNVTAVGVFTKEGDLVQQFAMNTLWSDLGSFVSRGDPIILYDEERKQWMISEFTTPNILLIAISETSDPLGSYYAYSFAAPNFPDYPKYGFWPNALVVTSNETGTGPGRLHQYFIERDSLMSGATNVQFQRVEVSGNNSEAGFLVTTPVDWNGDLEPTDSRPMTLRINDSSWGGVPEDQIEIYHFDIDFDDPNNTVVTNKSIVTTPFDSYPCLITGQGFACIPQMGGGGLDALPELIINIPHYRNFGTHESVVFSFVTDVTDGENMAGVRWVELRKNDGEVDWSLYQEGTFSLDDGLHRFQGTAAIDKFGNIALVYNVASADAFAGIRYTGRLASDPLGTMTLPETVVIEGMGRINGGGFFGDYPQISVDPLDQITFWHTSEYGSTSNGNTRIVAFQLTRDTFDLAVSRIIDPVSPAAQTANQPVTVSFINRGIMPVSNFEVGFSFENNAIEQMIIPGPLMPDSLLEVTFSNTIDISSFGIYPLSVYITAIEDQNLRNDTVSTFVRVLANNDASVSSEEAVAGCDDPFVYTATFKNEGVLTITRLEFELVVDGTDFDTIVIPTNIAPGNERSFNFNLSALSAGNHTAKVTVLKVNNVEDLQSDGNSFTSMLNIGEPEGLVMINLFTDEFPEETSWTIRDRDTDSVWVSSPAYDDELTLSTQEICLGNNRCYVFNIFDGAADGICCTYGEGFYTILNSLGDTIFISNGDFGLQEEFEFCLGNTTCTISGEVDVTHPSDADSTNGMIMVTGLNGMGVYNFSIDGGMTYQSSGIFENLDTGAYQVVVQDAGNLLCIYEEEVVLTAESTATKFKIASGATIKVLPNPNSGFFSVEVFDFKTEAYQMDVEVRSLDGQLLQVGKIGKYDDVFMGQFSLVDYPDGTYLIRFVSGQFHAITKVIKQQ